jgi:hypothetical protein
MLLGEVKAEALKIMNINTSMDISYLSISALKSDPTCAGYLYSMTGAINRAFDRLYIKEAVDEPITAISSTTQEKTDLETYGVNDVLARMVPMFIVGEIFAIEEPEVAANNRNMFESTLEEYVRRKHLQETQGQVETIYRVDI